MFEHLPLIVIEVVLVFGGALAFAWWQLRDLDREQRRREEARRQAPQSLPVEATRPASPDLDGTHRAARQSFTRPDPG